MAALEVEAAASEFSQPKHIVPTFGKGDIGGFGWTVCSTLHGCQQRSRVATGATTNSSDTSSHSKCDERQ